ncbi:MAG: glutamate--cysteine ligase [Candidatus Nanopelagicales bacterium]
MTLAFRGSPAHTLGIELEVGIVDDGSDELACWAPEILAEASADASRPGLARIKRELFESTLELVTDVCRTPAEARADLAATVAHLAPALRARNLSLISCGVHPFSSWEPVRVTGEDRYLRMVERFQWPVRRLTIYGVHYHVGVPTGHHAMATMNGLTRLLPHLLALSASSPFWYGRDTGLASVRTRLWESVPSAGVPPRLDDWSEFVRLVSLLKGTGTIETTHDLWWDVRPSPMLGTVELRICDSMSSLAQVCALAALAQAAVAHICDGVDRGEIPVREPDWVLRENKWRASRFGLSAEMVHSDGTVVPLVDEVLEWVDRVRPAARALGGEPDLDRVLDLLAAAPSYARQRDVIDRGGTLRDVVALLRREFAANAAAPDASAANVARSRPREVSAGGSEPRERRPGGRTGDVPSPRGSRRRASAQRDQ